MQQNLSANAPPAVRPHINSLAAKLGAQQHAPRAAGAGVVAVQQAAVQDGGHDGEVVLAQIRGSFAAAGSGIVLGRLRYCRWIFERGVGEWRGWQGGRGREAGGAVLGCLGGGEGGVGGCAGEEIGGFCGIGDGYCELRVFVVV